MILLVILVPIKKLKHSLLISPISNNLILCRLPRKFSNSLIFNLKKLVPLWLIHKNSPNLWATLLKNLMRSKSKTWSKLSLKTHKQSFILVVDSSKMPTKTQKVNYSWIWPHQSYQDCLLLFSCWSLLWSVSTAFMTLRLMTSSQGTICGLANNHDYV